MENEPKAGIVGLVLAHFVCCIGIPLFIFGVLTLNGIGAWLLDGGLVWLFVTAALVAGGLYYSRQRKSRDVLPKAPGQIRSERSR